MKTNKQTKTLAFRSPSTKITTNALLYALLVSTDHAMMEIMRISSAFQVCFFAAWLLTFVFPLHTN